MPPYILALLALLLEPGTLLDASPCLSSRKVTQIQNQLITSTNANANDRRSSQCSRRQRDGSESISVYFLAAWNFYGLLLLSHPLPLSWSTFR